MPPNNESQLAPSQIELLSWWIEHGASATITEEQLPPRLSHVAVSAAGPKVSREQQPAGSASAAATAPPLVASTNEAHPGRDERGVNLYRQVVAPILINRCGSCHTGSHVSGGLRVDDRASMVSEGDIVPGVADKSPLLTRMLLPASNPAHMPPSDKTQPAAAEMELIRTWIASGAKEDALVDPQDLPASVRALALAPPSTGTGTGDSGSESGKPADKARSMGPAPGHVAGCAACTVAHPDHDTDARGLWLSGLAATLLVTRYRRRPRLPQGSGSSGKCF
jgi:hypothetical protein